jgi:hypothetical protein
MGVQLANVSEVKTNVQAGLLVKEPPKTLWTQGITLQPVARAEAFTQLGKKIATAPPSTGNIAARRN